MFVHCESDPKNKTRSEHATELAYPRMMRWTVDSLWLDEPFIVENVPIPGRKESDEHSIH